MTTPETWGEAMVALLTEVKAGARPRALSPRSALIGGGAGRAFPQDGGRHQRDPRQVDRALSHSGAPAAARSCGRASISAVRDGRWEYVERAGRMTAVVIVAEHEGKVHPGRAAAGAARAALHRASRGAGRRRAMARQRRGNGAQGTGGGDRLRRRADRAAGRVLQFAGDGRRKLHAGARARRAARGRRAAGSTARRSSRISSRARDVAAFIAAKRAEGVGDRREIACCCWRAICWRDCWSTGAVRRSKASSARSAAHVVSRADISTER